MTPLPVIAIVDVGKTNKKIFLFDERYQIVWERTEQFPETVDDDGDPCEDLNRLTTWLHTSIGEVLALPQYEVRALNFSAYGASLVYVGAEGQPVGYLYNYLKAFPDALERQFSADYDPQGDLPVQTASPRLGSLNSGLMLYRIKHDKPALFRQIKYALHLPQYLCQSITNQPLTDLTSIGCHTMLWDFSRQQYHHWVVQEGLDQLMGQPFPADAVVSATVDGHPLRVGGGLHDSSSALIPYLVSFSEPFVLISTGTWCISMNPFNEQPLTAEELQYDCLCFLHFRGKPVKASRLFAGNEHEQQTRRLADHFGVPVDHYKQVGYNAALIEQLRASSDQETGLRRPTPDGLTPARMVSLHESAFHHRSLASFATYELAYHQLMLDLMAQQLISTGLVLHQSPVSRLFVDGGFSRNPIYMTLLASAFPDIEVWGASVAQASALGAALAIHAHWNPAPVPANLVSLTRYTAA